ncbi:regulator of hemoglobinization and erythroid cell expansion protein isoform X2 [Gallus gallus]|uniref:regulator of hemoglobinization and erythroid cell expansion protein isoform X2 n=1 Tax=Gallus gallus TaxID=9031 RepID=UPI001F014415|nr:regulator of hemoglobinization and erythroid cell expansion protein isoform X2 [Gallus gallus]XP_046760223.1 regulator of hemoglobinization and erythroid cell expansion protein isoform X2 [Gallus gallus]
MREPRERCWHCTDGGDGALCVVGACCHLSCDPAALRSAPAAALHHAQQENRQALLQCAGERWSRSTAPAAAHLYSWRGRGATTELYREQRDVFRDLGGLGQQLSAPAGKGHGQGSNRNYENIKIGADYVNVDPKKKKADFWTFSGPVASASIEYTEVKP